MKKIIKWTHAINLASDIATPFTPAPKTKSNIIRHAAVFKKTLIVQLSSLRENVEFR